MKGGIIGHWCCCIPGGMFSVLGAVGPDMGGIMPGQNGGMKRGIAPPAAGGVPGGDMYGEAFTFTLGIMPG